MALSPFVGDLSRSLALRQANFAAKTEMTTRSREATTGIRDDIPGGLAGDTRGLGHLESRLATLTAYDQASAGLGRHAQIMQSALEGVQGTARAVGANLLTLSSADPSVQVITAGLSQALEQLGEVVGRINTNIGGRFLFSGANVTQPPLPSAADLLAATQAAIGSPATAGDLIAAVSAFFDAPAGGGGYADVYQGDDIVVTASIGPGQSAGIDTNATAPAIRETLKGMTLLALAAEPPWAGDVHSQANIMTAARGVLLAADTDLSVLRGDVGRTEAAVARAQSRNSAESTALSIERNNLIRVDQYEALSAAAEAQTRLEAIYSMTARMSRLSLANYL